MVKDLCYSFFLFLFWVPSSLLRCQGAIGVGETTDDDYEVPTGTGILTDGDMFDTLIVSH
jgi:hypothetical protein